MSTLKVNTIQDASGGNSLTPSNVKQGIAKVWINYSQSDGSTRDSFNVSSVTNHATGQITVNFSTNMTGGNYCTVSAVAGVNGKVGMGCYTSTNYSGVKFQSSYTSSSSQRFNIVSSNPTGITQSVADIGIAFLES